MRELRLHRPQLPLDTLLFTDPNKDPDDVVTYTIAKQLQADGFLRLTDVVVTLGDADMRSQRAQLAKVSSIAWHCRMCASRAARTTP